MAHSVHLPVRHRRPSAYSGGPGKRLFEFFPWIQVGRFHYWRNPIANIVVFLPLLPAFIGSAVVEPTFPPAGMIGATIGSFISSFFTDSLFNNFGLREKDFYLILTAEHGPETSFNYILVGVVGGIVGWLVKSLWRERKEVEELKQKGLEEIKK